MAKEYCRFCGKEIEDDEMYCPECGKPTWKASENRGPSAPAGAPKVKFNFIHVLILALSVILIINLFMPSFVPVDNGPNYKLDYKWSVDDKDFELTMEVPKDYYSNNVLKSTIDRSGTVSSDRYVIPGPDGKPTVVFGVKDYIVIDKYVEEAAMKLHKLWESNYAESEKMPDLAQFFAYFCQTALDYEEDTAKGQNEYWKFPLETLVDGKGDCEDTAMLLAALIQADGNPKYSDAAGIFLLPGHAMGAIGTDAVVKEYENSHFGYYPIETALHKGSINLYKIGQVSDEYRHAYFHLYTGYTTEYYGVVSN